MAGERAKLDQLLGGAEMAWFVARVRARIAEAGGEPLTGVVRLPNPTAEQRRSAARLVGWPTRPAASVRIDLAEVEALLRHSLWPAGLADAVVTLTGPVVDRHAEQVRLASAWSRAAAELAPVLRRWPELTGWWRDWCATGQLKRLAGREARRLGQHPTAAVGADLVRRAAGVVSALPAVSEPLAVLAQRVTGDAHGLDAARPLGRLVNTVAGVAFRSNESGPPSQVETISVRAAWAAAGVVMSNVSCTALSLGVPGHPAGAADSLAAATATVLEAMRKARAPVTLTLDQVRSGGVAPLANDRIAYVCENPSILEVVARRWSEASAEGFEPTPVVVCTWGQPTTAVIELVEILVADGAECRYHGDFDWAGLRIAESLRSRVFWRPWRFGASDYLAALEHGETTLGLAMHPAGSPWDPELATVMAEHGRAVEEEAVADLLAADLIADPRGHA